MKFFRAASGALLAVAALAFAACHSSSSGSVPEGGTPSGGECTNASTCAGYGNPCYASVTCTNEKCAFQLQSPGYQVPDAQTPGDCSYVACDNLGNIKSVPDDLDRPDAGPCKIIFCVNSMGHDPEPAVDGTSCGPGLVCTGGLCDAGRD
ncbi:MAG: hypothetical protein ABI461_05580 [Polyangiaceae bacterium]